MLRWAIEKKGDKLIEGRKTNLLKEKIELMKKYDTMYKWEILIEIWRVKRRCEGTQVELEIMWKRLNRASFAIGMMSPLYSMENLKAGSVFNPW